MPRFPLARAARNVERIERIFRSTMTSPVEEVMPLVSVLDTTNETDEMKLLKECERQEMLDNTTESAADEALDLLEERDSLRDLEVLTLTPGKKSLFYRSYKERFIVPSKVPNKVKPQSVTCKVILVGPSGAGKTAFINQYIRKSVEKIKAGPTVGVKCQYWKTKHRDIDVDFQFWDIMGQDYYYRDGMNRSFYLGVNVAILLFDLTSRMSFVRAIEWKKHIDSRYSLPDGKPVPCFLVANKCDRQAEAEVTEEEIRTQVRNLIFIGWGEASSLQNDKVEACMKFVLDDVLKRSPLRNHENDLEKVNEAPSEPVNQVSVDRKNRVLSVEPTNEHDIMSLQEVTPEVRESPKPKCYSFCSVL